MGTSSFGARAVASAVLAAIVADAQAAGPEGVAPALEEIVITATKRTTSLMETPAQINVITAADLERSQVRQFADLSGTIPNLLAPNGLTGTEAVTIRGISSPARGGSIAEQPVSAYVDGVFAPSGSLDGLIFDIGQIEVIRGPQGVVWGRNTLAGALSFTTQRPTQTWEGYVDVGLGNYERREARGAISGPAFGARALMRLAAAHEERDGYAERLSGGTFGAQDRDAVRGTVQFFPTEGLDITIIGDYSQSDFTSQAPEWFSGPLAAAAGTDGFTRRQDIDFFRPGESTSHGATGLLSWDFGALRLSAVSGHRRLEQDRFVDVDSSPAHLIHDVAGDEAEQFSQELRLADTDEADRLDWMLGLYYYERKDSLAQSEALGPALAPVFGAPPGSTMALDAGSRTTTESHSAFATASFRITERFTVSGGIRLTEEDKTDRISSGMAVILPGGMRMPLGSSTADLDLDETQVSPLITLSYEPADAALLYASWGRGHKSGGFNSPLVRRPTFEAEEADTYEVGYKAHWLGGRLQASAAGFLIDYRDLQARTLDGVFAMFVNAGEARSRGAELELTAAPAERWHIAASFGYTDAKFDSFTFDGQDLDGNELSFAPETSFALRSSFALPLGRLGELQLHGEWAYTGHYYLDIQNSREGGYQPGYDLLNARASLVLRSGLELGLWGRNLTDEDYRVDFMAPAPILGGSAMQILAPPRTYGAEIRFRF